MQHPGEILIQQLREKGWTQKQFAFLLGKKVSELNELIKGKRNITIQWDLLLSKELGTPEKYWINKQIDYDYVLAKQKLKISSSSVDTQNTAKSLSNDTRQYLSKNTSNKNISNHRHEGIFRNF